eukprot:NODE_3129_length_1025_cov_17.896437_g2985_i0.p1 GENE.NODE_3129_length_1025_cov_17.896437_g2985_i0~~NODE_3129_length_1025_cov_17.896437_g2985_i0.p1  ORF type:complete len:284 (+),score=56.84 NODE_3129_length_1025_cov_17.896437_g2985_i0:70-921(+)
MNSKALKGKRPLQATSDDNEAAAPTKIQKKTKQPPTTLPAEIVPETVPATLQPATPDNPLLSKPTKTKIKKSKKKLTSGETEEETMICFQCHVPGHVGKDCPERKQMCRQCGQAGHLTWNCKQSARKSCFVCGNEGHMSLECPENGRGCLKCGIAGHYARDCVSEDTGKPVCFKCGEAGHFSRVCPQTKQEVCYKCGEAGHRSRECPNIAARSLFIAPLPDDATTEQVKEQLDDVMCVNWATRNGALSGFGFVVFNTDAGAAAAAAKGSILLCDRTCRLQSRR